jgi:glycosyltransferase involved in cell wall biosynthesis
MSAAAAETLTSGLTVIATVRNEHDSITDFVESLLSQSLAPAEIIIVDGESTDGTREILQKYADTGQIRLISRDCNIAEGRNLGISAANNDYIAVTDAGCTVDPDWLACMARCFASEEQPDVVAGNFRFDTHSRFEEAVVLATFSPDRDSKPRAKYYPSSRSVGFTRQAWEAAKGYPEWLYAAEDTLFNIRLRQLGMTFVFCRDAIVRWRPRTSWRSLARQRFNFSRGNARVGIGTGGYRINLVYHGLFVLALLATLLWPHTVWFAGLVAVQHIRKHLWSQARRAAEVSGKPDMFARVLLVMEWTRLVGVFGFLAGRYDRITNPAYIRAQMAWMGRTGVEDISE